MVAADMTNFNFSSIHKHTNVQVYLFFELIICRFISYSLQILYPFYRKGSYNGLTLFVLYFV